MGGARPRYGGRAGARARARALSRKSKARNQPNLENFKGNLSFDQRGKLFSFSFSTKRAFRKYRSYPYRGERTTFSTSYLKTHQNRVKPTKTMKKRCWPTSWLICTPIYAKAHTRKSGYVLQNIKGIQLIFHVFQLIFQYEIHQNHRKITILGSFYRSILTQRLAELVWAFA